MDINHVRVIDEYNNIAELKGTGLAFTKIKEIYDAIECVDKGICQMQKLRMELIDLVDDANLRYQELSAIDYRYYLYIRTDHPYLSGRGCSADTYRVSVFKIPVGEEVNSDNIYKYNDYRSTVDRVFDQQIEAKNWREVKHVVAEVLGLHPIQAIFKSSRVSDSIYKIHPSAISS